jgi:hypothetical protein
MSQAVGCSTFSVLFNNVFYYPILASFAAESYIKFNSQGVEL